MLDISIVNVALPSIQTDLGLGPVGAAWVVNAYVLAYGGLLLLSGRAADLWGRRRMFVAGSAVFTVGTVVAAASSGEPLLIAGRVLQGVGAAGLSPAAMSLLLISFPGEARARAMSTWGAASTLGGTTGVVAGGLLAGSLGWRSVFLVTVPISFAVSYPPTPGGRGVPSTLGVRHRSRAQSSPSSTVPSARRPTAAGPLRQSSGASPSPPC